MRTSWRLKLASGNGALAPATPRCHVLGCCIPTPVRFVFAVQAARPGFYLVRRVFRRIGHEQEPSHAAPEYRVPPTRQPAALGGAGAGDWRAPCRPGRAQAAHARDAAQPSVCATCGRAQPARHRGVAREPAGAALPCGTAVGAALAPGGRDGGAADGGVHRRARSPDPPTGGRKLRREIGDCVRLIDATPLPLSSLSGEWARFSAQVCGAKAHIVYDPDADSPLYCSVTPARVNDIPAAKEMPIEAGATYVFDLGYYDFGWWARLDEAACRIVTRLKVTTRLAVIEERPLPLEPGAILSDRIGFLPERQAHSRQNPMVQAVREVRVSTESGMVLRLLTNDLDAPAEEIAALYRRRWAIELFFRWVKQLLRIGHFYATSESAVAIQVTVALIPFGLLNLPKAARGAVKTLPQFARLVGAMLMQQTPIDSLRGQYAMLLVPPVQLRAQGVLPWAEARTGQACRQRALRSVHQVQAS